MAKVKITTTPYTGIIAKANARLNALNPAANAAAARKTAAGQLAPQLASEAASSQATQRALGQQFTRSSEFAKSMAAIRGEYGQQATAPYLEATGTLGYLGGGVGGAVAAAQQAAHDTAAQQVAQMTGGLGEVGATYNVPGMASTAQTLGVTLPGRALAAEAMGAAAGARNAADVTADRLGVIANEYNQKAADALAEHNAALRTIQAQRPGLQTAALQVLNERADRAQDLIATLTGQQAQWGISQRQLAQTAAGQAEQRRQFNASQRETRRQFNANIDQKILDRKEVIREHGVQSGLTQQQINESIRHDTVIEGLQQQQVDITGGYLSQAEQTGAVNRAATAATTRATIAGLTGYDPKTGKLAAGYMAEPKTGTPVKTKDWLTAQTKLEKANEKAKYGGMTAGDYAKLKQNVMQTARDYFWSVPPKQRWNPTKREYEDIP